jgi:hypothetical protein
MDPATQRIINALESRIAALEGERVDPLHLHNGFDSNKLPFTSITGAGQYARFYDIAFAGIMTFESEGTGGTSTKFYLTGYNGNSDPAFQITASESGVGNIDIGGAIKPANITVEAVTSVYLSAGGNDLEISSSGVVFSSVVTTTGGLVGLSGTATTAGGATTAGVKFGTVGIGIFFGSGAPTITAPKGSLYLRTDGSTTNDRAYINTNGGTTWTAIITAA